MFTRKLLERIGFHDIAENIESETSYKFRAIEMGLKSAFLQLSTPEECSNWEYVEGRFPGTDCHSVVLHIGGERHVSIEQVKMLPSP